MSLQVGLNDKLYPQTGTMKFLRSWQEQPPATPERRQSLLDGLSDLGDSEVGRVCARTLGVLEKGFGAPSKGIGVDVRQV